MPKPEPENPSTRVVLLGTGTPNAEPSRSGSCVAVIMDETALLVDCGPGVVRRAKGAFQRGESTLAMEKLSTVFLTHLHSDHTLGLPDLLLTPWVLGRQQPLRVYGPAGTRSLCESLQAAYAADVRERIRGPEPANTNGHRFEVHEIETGTVYETSQVRVEAIPAVHGSWQAFSYRFRTPDGIIILSGDTAPHASMVQEYAGSDLIVHEVYSAAGLKGRPPAWQAYHAGKHTSGEELAAVAAQVRPGLLVLYHQLTWGVSDEDLLAEIRQGYGGAVVSGKDLDTFDLSQVKRSPV